jgi:hypothetical protein
MLVMFRANMGLTARHGVSPRRKRGALAKMAHIQVVLHEVKIPHGTGLAW